MIIIFHISLSFLKKKGTNSKSDFFRKRRQYQQNIFHTLSSDIDINDNTVIKHAYNELTLIIYSVLS